MWKRIGTSDAARILGCDIRTVRRYMDSGALHAVKPGNRWLVLEREVRALAARRAMYETGSRRVN